MTSKKLLSTLMALVFALGMFTALPVSADGVTATVGGVAVADGGQICATSTVVFTVPADVTDLDMVTFYEKSKTPTSGTTVYPWFKRNFDGSLEGQTLTVIFERGDISSNSTYKFEFETNAESDGAEYTFNFVTVPEVDAEGKTVYFAENFSRYTWASNPERSFVYANWSVNPLPYNMDPIRKMRTWIGSNNEFHSGVDVANGEQFLAVYGNGPKFAQFGINPSYSGVVDSLQHLGEYTVQFMPTSLNNKMDFAGLAITQEQNADTGVVTWTLYGENTAKNPTSDNTFDAAAHTVLGTKTYADSAAAISKHTLTMLTDTTLTAAGAASRVLIQVKLDGDIVWQQGTNGSYTFPTTATGNGQKGVPWASSRTNSVSTITNLFNATNGTLRIYYAEYKDYVAEPMTLVSVANNYEASSSISWTFDKDVAVSSAIGGFVLERLNPDGSTWKTMNMDDSFLSVGSSKKVLTALFKDGDLTPGMTYRVKLTTKAKSCLGGALTQDTDYVTFTAKENSGHTIMKANFNQYPVMNTYAGDMKLAYPFYLFYGWTGNAEGNLSDTYPEGIRKDANGEHYIEINANTSALKTWAFINTGNAAALPAGETAHRGISTVTFSTATTFDDVRTVGNLNDMFGIAVQPTSDGTWNIYYRSSVELGYNYNGALKYPNHQQDNWNDYTLLGTYASGDTAHDGSEKHTIAIDSEVHEKYVAGTDRVIRTVYGIKIDGNPVCVDEIGNGVTLAYPGYFSDGIMWNAPNAHTANTLFMSSKVMVADSGTAYTYSAGKINIFEVSYKDAIEVDAAQEGTTLTFTVKNDTAAAASAIPVLAIYNGTKLVRVDGLAADATAIASGATETFTKAVTADEAGYSYKFMLLDSKDSLKPLWYATKGTIN